MNAQTATIIDLPPPWANVLPRKAAGPWTFCLPVITNTFPEQIVETVQIDPYAELEDGCLVVSMWKGGPPSMHVLYIDDGRGYRGRFVRPGSDDETFLIDGSFRVSRGDVKRPRGWRVLGRVIGERRRCPRYATWPRQ